MELNYLLLVLVGALVFGKAEILDEEVPASRRVFDQDLYKRVLDEEECSKQLTFLEQNDTLLHFRFMDAGVRFPRGVFVYSISDLGNYHQCLEISEEREDMIIEGKYSFIRIPLDQNLSLPWDIDDIFLPPQINNMKTLHFHNGIINDVQNFGVRVDISSLDPDNPLSVIEIGLGLCIPKVCTPHEWMELNLFNVSAIGFNFKEDFTRLPNDKPWAAADYVAIGVFSFIGLLTILCTLYDLNHIVIRKRDPKTGNIFGRMFSVYTNTKRLLTFPPNSNALECLDGIRSISMMWIIIGHAFSMHNYNANLLNAIQWLTSSDAVWISTGLFTVDTFFLIAGLLLVYVSVGRMTGLSLLKRLHIFYLNRLLRMFPLLAALVLLEASAFHRVGDGPYWLNVGRNVQRCRTYWWTTLLHVQNYVNPDDICIQHSWYIAIDIQLHFVSPLVLFWVLNKNRKGAWSALIIGLLAILTGSTIWNFYKELPSTNMTIPRLEEQDRYMNNYYMNTLTRGAPFFVGMIVGYILNMLKGKEIKLNIGFVLISWVISLGLIASCFYMSYVVMKLDWDNQLGDSLFNSFMRTIWALGLSWMIFACVKGYGGPINWFLTLPMWKVPARISYAMYLYHYPMMFVVAGMRLSPVHFSVGGRIYDFMALLTMSFIIAFTVTVIIDAPFSVLIKMAMEGGKRRRRPPANKPVERNPEPEPEKAMSTLTNNIITNITFLQKDPILEKKDLNLRENGAILENGDILERNLSVEEKNGPILERHISVDEKNTEVPLQNGGLDRTEDSIERQKKEISKF